MDTAAVLNPIKNVAKSNALKTFGVNFIIAASAFASYGMLDSSKKPILVGASIGAIAGSVIAKSKNPLVGSLIGAAIGGGIGFYFRDNATIKPIFA